MGIKRGLLIICLFSLLVSNSCGKRVAYPEKLDIPIVSLNTLKKESPSEEDLKTWHFKDVFIDTIPGISLNKAYGLLGHMVPDTIIVAVLDMSIDIEHEDLAHSIWYNAREIPSNGLDDDNNGYVDDVNGWNFIGWTNNRSSQFVNYEYTRILRKFDPIFKGKEREEIAKQLLWDYEQYKRAEEAFKEQMTYAEWESNNAQALTNLGKDNKALLSKYFPSSDFTIGKLDSLSAIFKEDANLQDAIEFRKELVQYGVLEKDIIEGQLKADERINKLLNLEYNDRKPLEDLYPDDLNYNKYGNNIVNYNTTLLDHGTLVAGVIAANRENEIGAKGVTNAVKIMPLSISAFGDEHDKDLALAIRYAVDNGARIINISSGKTFSMHPKLVQNAIEYAAIKDVLIVTSAGNDGLNLDKVGNYNFPNDTDLKAEEISDNFIKVGSVTHKVGKDLFDIYSNYGKREVDIFAPGKEIYTTSPNQDNYSFESGTSFAAPMVAGVAALIFSYYPHLSAEEVKKIILETGIEYKMYVNISKDEEQPKLVPFVTLCKSGKVINAYYALKLAELLNGKKL